MNTREIRVNIDNEQVLYEELYSAMMEHREYDGCYVMQYSERQEHEGMVAVFMLRESSSWPALQDPAGRSRIASYLDRHKLLSDDE